MNLTSQPGRLRARRKEALHEEILAAAESVLAVRGAARATMQEIAGAAGVSVGTLYNQFRNREDVLRALFQLRRRGLAQHLDRAGAGSREATFREELACFVRAVFEYFVQHERFVRIALDADSVPSRTGARGAAPALTQIQARARELVEKGIEEGALRADEPELLAASLTGMLRAVLIARVGVTAEAGALADFVIGQFLRGAGA